MDNFVTVSPISGILSGSKPDLLEPISFGSEVRLLALEQELQELRAQVSMIVKSSAPLQRRKIDSLVICKEKMQFFE